MRRDGNLRQPVSPAARTLRRRSHGEELTTRLDAVERWLAQRFTRSEILTHARKRWRVSTRQTDRYIAQATARYLGRIEPTREACRRLNLATLDTAIAQAFGERKLRDVAALVRLRAMLDGSLTPPGQLSAPPFAASAPESEVKLPDLLRSLADLARSEIYSGHCDPAAQQEMALIVEELASAVRQTPCPSVHGD